jgi:hypothetical protein
MFIDRHPAAIISDLKRAILIKYDIDTLAMTGHGLIDTVVNNFMGQVIRTRRIGVHAGTTPNRLQAAQNFDIGCAVAFTHSQRHLCGWKDANTHDA